MFASYKQSLKAQGIPIDANKEKTEPSQFSLEVKVFQRQKNALHKVEVDFFSLAATTLKRSDHSLDFIGNVHKTFAIFSAENETIFFTTKLF